LFFKVENAGWAGERNIFWSFPKSFHTFKTDSSGLKVVGCRKYKGRGEAASQRGLGQRIF
jgi:hypothetical protein